MHNIEMKDSFPAFSPAFIRNYFLKNNASIRKTWGQNFLIDPNSLRHITQIIFAKPSNLIETKDKVGIDNGNNILEIGPGFGALTHFLLNHANVTAIEIDPVLFKYLNDEFTQHSDRHTFTPIHQNVLHYLEEKDKKAVAGRNLFHCIVGNLPYSITTELIISLMKYPSMLQGFFLVQKEYAQRIITTHKVNSIGVYLQNFGNWKIHFHISPNCFYPRPSINSSLISFDRYTHSQCKPELLEKLLRLCFSGRRKTLFKNWKDNLHQYFPNLDLDFFLKLTNKCGIANQARAEDLQYNTYYQLTNLLAEVK